MAHTIRISLLAAGLALALPLGAQQYEPTIVGVTGRLSQPEGDLKDATGGFGKPGFGFGVFMEEDFLDGYRGRLGLGTDMWFKGNWVGKPGVTGGVTSATLYAEGVKMLRPDADPPLLGPYVLAGVGLTAWSLTTEAAGVTTTSRATHVTGTFGFGWRFAEKFDVEIKILYGKVNTDFTAGALMAGVNYRF